MADEGPTTAATLIAKFKGDDSDVMESIRRVKAAAVELGATDTDVHIDASGADRAIADIERTKAATEDLALADATLTVSSGRVSAAQQKLGLATDTLKLAYQRLDEVQTSATAKQSTLMAAHIAASRAEMVHADAVRELTAAQAEETAASEAETASTKEFADAADSARPRTIAIGAAIAGVIALLGPLAAGVAAAGGGLAGMGAAGVLAILGIKKQMQDGTRVGDQYAEGVQHLSGYLDELEKTAADRFLASFQSIEQDIAGDMPALNSEVAQFTGILGDAAATAVPAIIDGLRVMNPLFVDGANLVDGMAHSFADWEASGGMQKFVTYAEKELPKIERTVVSLTDATVDLAEAWSPVGDTLMQVAEAGGHVISFYSDVTKWVNGLHPALTTGNKDLDDFIGGFIGGVTGVGFYKGGLDAVTGAINWLSGATDTGTKSTKAHTSAVETNKNTLKETAAQYGVSVSAYQDMVAAQKKDADQTAQNTRSMIIQSDAAGLLKQQLDILNGKTLDVAEAQTGMAAANNSLTDSMRENGLAIDGNSEKAVANQQAIQQSVEAAQQYAEAVGTQTGSSEAATAALAASKQQLEDNLSSQGLLTGAVQAYIDSIFQIPTSVSTKIDIDTAVATLKVQALAREIVNLSASYQSVTARMPGSIAVTKATGGTIGGYAAGGTPGFAAGGGPSGTAFGPGSTTSDSILTRLSVGEEVIKASSARQVRPLLKAINRDPRGALSGVLATGMAAGQKVEKHAHLHIDGTGYQPDALFSEFQRRENLRNQ